MIEAQNLVKWYGLTHAIDNLTFSIPSGQIVGFLGPNGAGKSTTLRILTGYLPPTSGRATVAGHDVLSDSLAMRRKIGYMPETAPTYPEMRVEEYLQYRGKLYGMERALRRHRIDIVTERCGLAAARRRLVGQLSKGNRQRVALAQALLHDPEVLILDEPTTGLDPNQIGAVRQLIRELGGDHTILLSSHILPEVEKTADQVMIISRGRIVAEGTPDELRRSAGRGGRIRIEVKASPQAVQSALATVNGSGQVEVHGHGDWCEATVTPADGRDIRESLGSVLHKNQWMIRELRHETASLEQFFVQITADQEQATDASP